MIPSTRFSVSAFGTRAKTELQSLTVTLGADQAQVSVQLESVTDVADLPELSLIPGTGTKPGASRRSGG